MAEGRGGEVSLERGAPADVVVVGVGNRLRGDDAAGLEAVRALRARLRGGELSERVAVCEHERETLGLIELWAAADAALIVDAVRSGAPPGSVHRIDAVRGPLPAQLRSSSSTHAVGVAEAIELARELGRLPTRTVLYGIEADTFASGEALSEPVRAAIGRVVDELVGELRRLAGLDDLDRVE